MPPDPTHLICIATETGSRLRTGYVSRVPNRLPIDPGLRPFSGAGVTRPPGCSVLPDAQGSSVAPDLREPDRTDAPPPGCDRAVTDLPTAQVAGPGSAPGAGMPGAAEFQSPTWVRNSDESADAPLPRAGEFFDGFELLSELGRGAMGRVFRAQ
jgi:hypothetical protein